MKNKIEVISRKIAEELIEKGIPENTAIISFSDPKTKRTPPDYRPVKYPTECEHVFYVPVLDIDIEILEDFGLTYDMYFQEAPALAEFICRAVDGGMDIICQCEYGQSRSAACAAAIKEFFEKDGISIFADYRYYPNQLIFNKLLASLKSYLPKNYERTI